MRQHRSIRVITAALAAASAGLVPAVMTLPAAAADTVVASADFTNGDFSPFVQSGNPTLTVVDDGTGSNMVLNVADRAADSDGVSTAPSALTAGTQYRVSADVRLAPGTTGTSTMRLVGHDGASAYDWIKAGDATAASWTTLTGTWTLPAGSDVTKAKIYIGSGEIADPAVAYAYQVDNFTVTAIGTVTPPPPPTGGEDVVWNLDFNSGTFAPWRQSGAVTAENVTYVDDGNGGTALSFVRKASYDSIQTPVGVLEPGREYTFSLRAKVDAASAGVDAAVRAFKLVSSADNYATVPGTATTLTGDWQTITGTYTIPADADPLTTNVYIGVGPYPEVATPVTVIIDDLKVTTPATGVNLVYDFEDGTQGWAPRASEGTPTVDVTTAEFHGGKQALLVSDRTGKGDGAQIDLTDTLVVGKTYDVTGYVKMAAGVPADSIWLSAKTTTADGDKYTTVAQFDGVTNGAWTKVTASYPMPDATAVTLYFETSYNTGSNGDFLVDDVTIADRVAVWDPTLTPMKDTVDFPLGVAIDTRETSGAASELLLHHFDQITPENDMKVEAWYDDAHNFRMNPAAKTLMDFAVANHLRLYGHTLVWHSQTPDWFFQDAEGNFLTSADKAEMDTRLKNHIFNVAKSLSDAYGKFGSDTNPLVAFDVVNEVISDQATPDGLRTSHWYQIMGADFISQAFKYADEAFNGTYAVDDSVKARPITLMINDYNTEQDGKGARLHTLVANLLKAGVPVDGVGHQMHVALSTAVDALEASIDRFADLPVKQAVTELDVTVGTPVTTPSLIEQGYYYRDLFDVLRANADKLFSVTIWGLTDDRSWRTEQSPLVFDSKLGAKQAYYGIADPTALEPRIRTANVFQGSVAIDAKATTAPEWAQLQLHAIEDAGKFQLRWMPDHLAAYVTVADTSVDAADAVSFVVAGKSVTVHRGGTGDVPAVVKATATGYTVVASIPLATEAKAGSSIDFDVEITNGSTTTSWGGSDADGSVTLVEPLSTVEIAHAATAPVIDGAVDAAWDKSGTVATGKAVQGASGATATVKTLWKDNYLYVLMDVADPIVDLTGSDPWIQDSVEIYVDPGNAKNGAYRYDDTQIRINADNVASFGSGDTAYQEGRLQSATARTATGYRVEARIDMLEYGGLGTFHGVDFQVNDAANGARTSIRNWADPTGAGYQSTARWGVGAFVEDVQWPFSDVRPGHPFLTEISWMFDSGLTRGYDDGTFRGMSSVNRDAMAAFLYRLMNDGATAPKCTTSPFPDVLTTHPFCGEIAWLKAQGISTGYADGTYRPAAPVARDAMAAFLYRIENGPDAPAACTSAPFVDVAVNHPFCAQIAWLKDQKLASGWSDGTFRPAAEIERQAMAAFLYRGVVQKGMFGELWTPPVEFVPGGAVNPTASQVNTARAVEGNTNVAALTFDDGPMYAADTNRLLDFLATNHIKATFCVIGQNIKATGGADLLKRMVADGHTLCNHGTTYDDMGSWTTDQVQADLLANLTIIRDALGDPNAKVPYFRAPNGSWGKTEQVAANLGMQPLGLGNVINDWEDAVQADVTQLEANLNTAIKPGAVVLAHVGGGSSRANGITAVINVVTQKLADGWVFTLPQGGIPDPAPVLPAPVNGMLPA